MVNDFINLHNANAGSTIVQEVYLPLHPYFTKTHEIPHSAGIPQKRSQEPLWSYQKEFGISISWLFRADIIFVLIKDVFQSFFRYTQQLRLLIKSLVKYIEFQTILQNVTIQTQVSTRF